EMIVEEILPYIPDNRIEDVLYFNPADTERPVSFNPLQMDEGEDIDLKVDENLTIFRRIMGDTGPRMDEILRQSFYALIEKEGTTLLDFEKLLSRDDPTFRNEVISKSSDPDTVHFFRDAYPHFPNDSHLPITTRLGKLLRPKTIRSLLCRTEGSLNFREAMDRGKILLFNLSDGILGEANSQLLGQLIVSKFQTAVMSRANIPKGERRDFRLYIDEFQTFTGTSATSYEKILSRARKYKLGLVLAHQQTGQIPLDLLKEIMGNVSTFICFNVSRGDATKLARELITQTNMEISRIREEEILRLKVGQAYCKIGNHSFYMETYLMPERKDPRKVAFIIDESRRRYGASSYLPPPTKQIAAKEHKELSEDFEEIDPRKVF
ncbi:MAG TPA: type IV secretory system conjugative DNA transfer family protein, partial [Thermodesulfobacteriota bacterium]|nr:type IV secretory system conjugative DNA transfer family protein [Thermodesulfobacteriota bacterium]